MWTDRDQKVIYQTQWFDTKLTVFDRTTGKLLRNLDVGESPAHVMTRVDTDQVHVSINGEDNIVELSPGGKKIERRLATQHPGELPGQPHAHWMSHDGHVMVTPNSNTNDSTRLDVPSGATSSMRATTSASVAVVVSQTCATGWPVTSVSLASGADAKVMPAFQKELSSTP
jgi:hypothetical protein